MMSLKTLHGFFRVVRNNKLYFKQLFQTSVEAQLSRKDKMGRTKLPSSQSHELFAEVPVSDETRRCSSPTVFMKIGDITVAADAAALHVQRSDSAADAASSICRSPKLLRCSCLFNRMREHSVVMSGDN